jgi:hypothetical protein
MKWAFAVLVHVSVQVSVHVLLAIWPATIAAAQPLSVYSEFARIDPQGNVVAPETPREIISPALIRNGFTSFQVVVQVPMNTPYMLRIGQNPDNAAKVTLYRFAERRVDPIAEPVNGDATQIFWMDVWIDKDAPVRRIKVEPQLFVNGDWVIYPMEMRVREQIVPDAPTTAGSAVTASPFDLLRGYLCDGKHTESRPGNAVIEDGRAATADDLHVRNARQDVALASALPQADREELRKRMGGCNARVPENPEFYLRLRDYFVTPLWMKVAHGN